MLTEEKRQHFLKFFSKFKAILEKQNLTIDPSHIVLDLLNGKWLEVKCTTPYEEYNQNIEKYKLIQEELESLSDNETTEENFEDINLESFYEGLGKVGTKFFPPTFKHMSTGEEKVIESVPGEILVLDFWAIWCGPCVGAMHHNYKIIEENFDKWNGKVKFVTASLVEKAEQITQFLKENEWNKYETVIDHYINMRSQGKDFAKPYGAKYIPFVVVVDKQGVVQFSGNPGGVKLEDKINELLDQTEFTQKETTSSSPQKTELSAEDKQQMQTLINFFSSHKATLKELKYNGEFNLFYVLKGRINNDLTDITFECPEQMSIAVELRKNEFDSFKEKLIAILPNYESLPWLKSEIKLMETFSITPLDNCSKCNNTIPETQGQYHCYWCKISFCESCTESLLTNEGRAKLVHPEHNLLYFKTRNPDHLKDLDLSKLGNNLFVAVPDEMLSSDHSASCDGCSNGFSNIPRFICVSCRPGVLQRGGYNDFCDSCVNVLKSPSNENYENVKNKTPTHDPESHVYLRLVFDVSYFRY